MVSHSIRDKIPYTVVPRMSIECLTFITLYYYYYYHWPALHVRVTVHLLRVFVCGAYVCSVPDVRGVWRNIVKCMCICTRLSLSAMWANSQRQIKHSPLSRRERSLASVKRAQMTKRNQKQMKRKIRVLRVPFRLRTDISVLFFFSISGHHSRSTIC